MSLKINQTIAILLSIVLLIIVSSCTTEVSEGSGSEVGNAITVSVNPPSTKASNFQLVLLPLDFTQSDTLDLINSDSTYLLQLDTPKTIQIEGLKSGNYRISLVSTASQEDRIVLGASIISNLSGGESKSIEMSLRPTSNIVGQVDSSLYNEYSDLFVQIQGTHQKSTVTPSGSFKFTQVPYGSNFKISLFSKANWSQQNQTKEFNLTEAITFISPIPQITQSFPQDLTTWEHQNQFHFDWASLGTDSPIQGEQLVTHLYLTSTNTDFSLIDPSSLHFRVINNLGQVIPSRISHQDFSNKEITLSLYTDSLIQNKNDTLSVLWDSSIQPLVDFSNLIFTHDKHVVTWDFYEDIQDPTSKYFGLDYNSNSELLALAGNSTIESFPTKDTGKLNHSQLFDGVDDFIQLPSTSLINLDSTFTIQFWTKVNLNQGYNQRFSYREKDFDIKEVDGSIQFACGPSYFLSNEKIIEDTWTQITITGDLSLDIPNISIYLNDSKLTAKENTFPSLFKDYTRQFNSNLFIGALDASSFFLKGSISNYRILRIKLSDEEIKAQYQLDSNSKNNWTQTN